MNTNSFEKKFCVIGCGRLGTTLSVYLSRKGFVPAAFVSRTPASARSAAMYAGDGTVYDDPARAAETCPLVFITTPDQVIEATCERISAAIAPGTVVFHTSGALSSEILSAARDAGAETGSLHPLQSFAPYCPGQPSPFAGINMSVEGTGVARDLGRQIILALDARPFTIPTRSKTLYHAAAVAASNYLVTLENFAVALLCQTGLSPSRAFEILSPLIQGTLNNISRRGCTEALTGPVVRGDREIISRHLSDIDREMPEFSELYRLLGRHTLELARNRPDFPEKTADSLMDLFKTP